MADLLQLFKQLNKFFQPDTTWEDIAEICDTQTANDKSKTVEYGTESAIISIPLVKNTLENPQINSLLLEICSAFRILRQESFKSYSNAYDTWDEVIKDCPREPYLAFVYGLASLANIEPNLIYYKLSLLVVNTYFYSLTIPGSHGYHIFDAEVIAHCLQVFDLVERVQTLGVKFRGATEVLINFATLLDDLKIILRWVHVGEHATTRNAIIRKLLDIQYYHFNNGYANACAANIHTKCFDIFDELVKEYNGPPEETLMKLINMSVNLHTYTPKPKGCTPINETNCEHISTWFTKWITKLPRVVSHVLNFYIKCIITNPIKTWQNEQVQRALDYAAKYDSELFINCNESCIDFLCEAIYADEVLIRSRTIDMISRMLQIESKVNWSIFRNDVSNEPREIYLIKELIDSLQDVNNNIKSKAMQALQTILSKGSKSAQTVFIECLKYTQYYDTDVKLPDEPRLLHNEVRYQKPSPETPNYTFEGFGTLELSFLNLPKYIYTHILHNKLTYVRRAGVSFLEQIVKINPLIIYNTNFVSEMTEMSDEPNILARRQCLVSIDNILEKYPNCYAIIWVWCKIISPMFCDNDPKNLETAMKCFHNKVLLNMEVINKSNKAEHFMPWLILRTFLITQSRLYLQTCFKTALQKQMINTKILSIIESHLMIANSTQIEAWVVLNFISGKIKNKEPDNLLHCFTAAEPWDKEQTQLIAFEVLANCVQDFTKPTLNYWSQHLQSEIYNGQMHPIIVGKALNFLIAIDKHVQTTSKDSSAKSNQIANWIVDLHSKLEQRITSGIKEFPDNRATLLSQLYSYSEINVLTSKRPPSILINFMHKFIRECLKLPEAEFGSENERVFNSMIIITARFSLGDPVLAASTCKLYAQILIKIDRPSIVNTIIVSITDLCKKHTQSVESILPHLLQKLSSPFLVNRKETFKCLEILILQDQLKLRSTLLLSLLSVILDNDNDLAAYACNFFKDYTETKNAMLFQKCLVECPFVLNEYKNFEGLDSFSKCCSKSPLKGEINRKRRHSLYKYFMEGMQEPYLISHFSNLNLIADKCQKDPLMKTEEGLALVKDVLYILKHICRLAKEHKKSNDKAENETQIDESLEELNLDVQASTTSTPNAKSERGRKRQKVLTMSEAINTLEKCLVFIPTIYDCTHKSDASLQKYFDELCILLAKRFPNLTDYAQPAAFWKKYRKMPEKKKSRKSSTKRKSQKTQNIIETDEDEENVGIDDANGSEQMDNMSEKQVENKSCADTDNEDFCSDDEVPLSNNIGTNAYNLPLEYLFNPSI